MTCRNQPQDTCKRCVISFHRWVPGGTSPRTLSLRLWRLSTAPSLAQPITISEGSTGPAGGLRLALAVWQGLLHQDQQHPAHGHGEGSVGPRGCDPLLSTDRDSPLPPGRIAEPAHAGAAGIRSTRDPVNREPKVGGYNSWEPIPGPKDVDFPTQHGRLYGSRFDLASSKASLRHCQWRFPPATEQESFDCSEPFRGKRWSLGA